MNQSKISVRYAKALFSLAEEKNALEKTEQDLAQVYELCDNPDFRLLLESPVVQTSQKQKAFKELFQEKFDQRSLSFLNLVLKNKRELFLKDIARNFLDQARKHKGIKQATLVSAVRLDEPIVKKIEKLIAQQVKAQVEITRQIDKSLIGGFILRIEDQQFDASVATKLKKIERQLLETPMELTTE